MRFRKKWWGSWWRLGKLREVLRCLLWKGLRHHCPMYNVSCIFFNKCLYFSYYMVGYLPDRPHKGQRKAELRGCIWSIHCIFLILIDGLKSLPFLFFSFLIFYLFIFIERRREGEREGEKHQCVRDTPIGHLSHTPNWGPGPQPRHVPWLGMDLMTFRFAGQHSVYLATPARALLLF